MKGEPMHAVFAEVKQQRAEQDQDEPRLDPAGQKRQPQDGDTCQKRGDTAVTKKHEEHLGPSSPQSPCYFIFPSGEAKIQQKTAGRQRLLRRSEDARLISVPGATRPSALPVQ